MDTFDTITHSPYLKILHGMAVLIVLISLPLPFLFWSALPDRIPQHFGAVGFPDSWGGRANIFLYPVANVLFIVFSFAYRPPEKNPRQYFHTQVSFSLFRVWVVSYLTYTTWMAIQIALGKAQDLGAWFSLVSLGIVIVIVGYASVASYITDRDNE